MDVATGAPVKSYSVAEAKGEGLTRKDKKERSSTCMGGCAVAYLYPSRGGSWLDLRCSLMVTLHVVSLDILQRVLSVSVAVFHRFAHVHDPAKRAKEASMKEVSPTAAGVGAGLDTTDACSPAFHQSFTVNVLFKFSILIKWAASLDSSQPVARPVALR